MINLQSDKAAYGIKIPTAISEITKEYFDTLLKDFVVSEHYSIIAVCYKSKLNELLFSANKPDAKAETVILSAKSDYSPVGDVLLLDSFSIERSQHINVPNNVNSISSVYNYCASDKELYNDIIKCKWLKANEDGSLNNPVCYFIEFKVIANSEIKLHYHYGNKFNNIFKIESK